MSVWWFESTRAHYHKGRHMDVKIIDVSGIDIVSAYVGLPVGHVHESAEQSLNTLSRLVVAGDEHAKLCRMIVAWFEITAPRYWWQEMATYRVGVEAYSGSTMHTLTKRPLTMGDFQSGCVTEHTLNTLNDLIAEKNLHMAKALLPESFLQTRLVMASYQALRRMWKQRRRHRLKEWHVFLGKVEELPCARELIVVK